MRPDRAFDMRHDMPGSLDFPQLSERQVRRIAELVALKIRTGDIVALHGDLGAGKTTFARALIRALLGSAEAEVPSPTFSLVQSYASPRLTVTHADLYRLADPAEALELGLQDAANAGCLIVEWPERGLDAAATGCRLDILFDDVAGHPDARRVRLQGDAGWTDRIGRIAEIEGFLTTAQAPFPIAGAVVGYLQGDASPRAYARLVAGDQSAVLMDSPRMADGPPIRDGLPYSRIAHLAEDVRPFVAVAKLLAGAGLSAPSIYAQDLDRGLLLIEDFGDAVFGRALDDGESQDTLWRAATDTLIDLRTTCRHGVAGHGSATYVPPLFDRDAMAIETELLLDWYLPSLTGQAPDPGTRAAFSDPWNWIFDRLAAIADGVVLRDFHSPNLMWLPDRDGVRRVGILDFQDALRGPWAYDLVSLLQDARLDVPAALEAELLAHYCAAMTAADPAFDRSSFLFDYAALGAQRNTKILGIFARLARRDGKSHYLKHIPRIWGYLERNLQHPDLAGLRAWYDRSIPTAQRARPLSAG